MPQLTLKLSNNIETTMIDFRLLFSEIHNAMRIAPGLDVSTCHSGVIKEDFSYIGLGDERLTKIYLEIYWLETDERAKIKAKLAQELMKVLAHHLASPIEKQNLCFAPRVRITDLGKLNQEYHIYNS